MALTGYKLNGGGQRFNNKEAGYSDQDTDTQMHMQQKRQLAHGQKMERATQQEGRHFQGHRDKKERQMSHSTQEGGARRRVDRHECGTTEE